MSDGRGWIYSAMALVVLVTLIGLILQFDPAFTTKKEHTDYVPGPKGCLLELYTPAYEGEKAPEPTPRNLLCPTVDGQVQKP